MLDFDVVSEYWNRLPTPPQIPMAESSFPRCCLPRTAHSCCLAQLPEPAGVQTAADPACLTWVSPPPSRAGGNATHVSMRSGFLSRYQRTRWYSPTAKPWPMGSVRWKKEDITFPFFLHLMDCSEEQCHFTNLERFHSLSEHTCWETPLWVFTACHQAWPLS